MENRKKIAIVAIIILLMLSVVGFYFFMQYKTYEKAEFTTKYENHSKDNAGYAQCLNGILRYGRDGVALFSEDGTELWNQSCQMKNPVVEICGESVAIGDKGGTDILVFQKKGLKGEIKTPKTIEKFAVSSQGIVSAILKDEEAPLVMCYDAAGTKLVEHTVAVKKMGYPIEVAISPDGNTLILSYLHTKDGGVVSNVVYYYFGDDYTQKKDYQVCQKEYSNTIIPEMAFMKNEKSVLIGDNALIFYDGLKAPKEDVAIEVQTKIMGVAYNEEYIALVVQNNNSGNYEMKVYNTTGKMLCSVEVDKEYAGMKVIGKQILLYDGQECSIYLTNGVHRYQGTMEQRIMELYPKGNMSKYMVINASGFYEVQLVE